MKPWPRTALAVLLALPLACAAASFDCQRARSKLNRTICADSELSRLDQQVWNAYGERIRGLTPLQYAHVRERHILWRRSRGLYETSVAALVHDYRNHLAWLDHRFFRFAGRYQRESPGRSTAHFEAEADLRRPDALDLRGLADSVAALAWRAAARAATVSGPADAAHATGARISIRFSPVSSATDAGLSEGCDFDIAFDGDEAILIATQTCGKAFDGTYSRAVRE